jgi:hypothetical protein
MADPGHSLLYLHRRGSQSHRHLFRRSGSNFRYRKTVKAQAVEVSKFRSVRFSTFFAKPGTELRVQFGRFGELELNQAFGSARSGDVQSFSSSSTPERLHFPEPKPVFRFGSALWSNFERNSQFGSWSSVQKTVHCPNGGTSINNWNMLPYLTTQPDTQAWSSYISPINWSIFVLSSWFCR